MTTNNNRNLFGEMITYESQKWIDFSRKHDPTNPQALSVFDQEVLSKLHDGDILCFWTKSPNELAEQYSTRIKALRDRNVLVLVQVSVNGYDKRLEPGVPKYDDIQPLIEVVEGDHIRLRFDPIIPDYTAKTHFERCVRIAQSIQASQITVNFIANQYPQALARVLKVKKITPNFSDENKIRILKLMQDIANPIKLAMCAESNYLTAKLPNLLPGRCADPNWALQFGYSLSKGHASRAGCGCVYTQSVNVPGNCKHGCVYCYANKQ